MTRQQEIDSINARHDRILKLYLKTRGTGPYHICELDPFFIVRMTELYELNLRRPLEDF